VGSYLGHRTPPRSEGRRSPEGYPETETERERGEASAELLWQRVLDFLERIDAA